MTDVWLYTAGDAVPGFIHANPGDVAAYIAAGAYLAFEYGNVGSTEQATLQLFPRNLLEQWTVSAGASPSQVSRLSQADLILTYLRLLGRTGVAYLDVTLLTPGSGSTAGGDAVQIDGKGFLAGFPGATTVTFGGVAATSVVVVSDTQITCVTPAHSAGTVTVVVTNNNGSPTHTRTFDYA